MTEGLRHTMPSCVCQAVGTSVGTKLADGRLQGLGRVISIYCAASPRKNLRHVNSQGLCKHWIGSWVMNDHNPAICSQRDLLLYCFSNALFICHVVTTNYSSYANCDAEKNNSEQRRGKAGVKCYPNLNLYSNTGMENVKCIAHSAQGAIKEHATAHCLLFSVQPPTPYSRFSRALLGFQCSYIVWQHLIWFARDRHIVLSCMFCCTFLCWIINLTAERRLVAATVAMCLVVRAALLVFLGLPSNVSFGHIT